LLEEEKSTFYVQNLVNYSFKENIIDNIWDVAVKRRKNKRGDHYPGKMSVTNAYVYNTFVHYLMNDYDIKMYGYELPDIEVKVKILGEEIMVKCQIYHAYETIFLNKYAEDCGSYPYLSDNCDPEY
jgi:hypothetical protein